jgi:hypothetical protein
MSSYTICPVGSNHVYYLFDGNVYITPEIASSMSFDPKFMFGSQEADFKAFVESKAIMVTFKTRNEKTRLVNILHLNKYGLRDQDREEVLDLIRTFVKPGYDERKMMTRSQDEIVTDLVNLKDEISDVLTKIQKTGQGIKRGRE